MLVQLANRLPKRSCVVGNTMSYALAPLLTERDDAESAEGGIDPLGLYTVADVLSVRMVGAVRERQAHPRFLTMLAVSLSL